MTATMTLTQERFKAYLVFLLWPFLGLVHAMRNIRATWVPNVIWFFCAFFGYTFIIAFEDVDAVRYQKGLDYFYENREKPIQTFFIETFNKGEYSGTDIYSLSITLAVSRFTNDFRLFFGIIGLVFGYFYSRNILYVLRFLKADKLKLLTILLLITLALLIPVWNINGYRFYTAAMVFIFGALRVICERRYRFLFFVFISPLFHFSFAFPLAVLLIYLILGNRYWIYSFMLLGSIYFSELNPAVVNENADNAPMFMRNKVRSYSATWYMKRVNKYRQGDVWYLTGRTKALNFVVYLFVFYIFRYRRQVFKQKAIVSLFCFGLFLLAMTNYISSVPSMGRFHALSLFILLSAFAMISRFGNSATSQRRLSWVFFAPAFLYCLVEIRIGFDFMGLNLLFLNPLIAWYFPDSVPLISFFK